MGRSCPTTRPVVTFKKNRDLRTTKAAHTTSIPWWIPGPVMMLPGLWSRVFDLCSSPSSQLYSTLSLSLSLSPSLSKTSITNLKFSPLSYSIHPQFFPDTLNFFLFLQFLHKSFKFLPQIHPKSPSTLSLFHSKFTPFLPRILHLS